jgi:hypothetical protein
MWLVRSGDVTSSPPLANTSHDNRSNTFATNFGSSSTRALFSTAVGMVHLLLQPSANGSKEESSDVSREQLKQLTCPRNVIFYNFSLRILCGLAHDESTDLTSLIRQIFKSPATFTVCQAITLQTNIHSCSTMLDELETASFYWNVVGLGK